MKKRTLKTASPVLPPTLSPAIIEDDYSDSYGYGSRFGASPIAKHGLGWVDEGSDSLAVGKSFHVDEPAIPEVHAKRADELVHDEVCERLAQDTEMDTSDVEISVADGQVTLSGTVPEWDALEHAESVIRNLPGVLRISNRLAVHPRHLRAH